MIEGFGHPFQLVLVYAVGGSVTVGIGYALEVHLAWAAGWIGAALPALYWTYKPSNMFSDTILTPKSFDRLRLRELRALAYLNSRDGKKLAAKIAVWPASLPLLGALGRQVGLIPTANMATPDPNQVDPFLPAAVMSFCVYACTHTIASCRRLTKRWLWIQEHQALPSAGLLAKYSRRWTWLSLDGPVYPRYQKHTGALDRFYRDPAVEVAEEVPFRTMVHSRLILVIGLVCAGALSILLILGRLTFDAGMIAAAAFLFSVIMSLCFKRT